MEPNIKTTEREKLPAKNNKFSKAEFKYEGDIKTFPDTQRLRELITRIPLKEIFKGVILPDTKNKMSQNYK